MNWVLHKMVIYVYLKLFIESTQKTWEVFNYEGGNDLLEVEGQ